MRLLSVATLLLTGCGPMIVAFPPPTMLPGTLDAPEPGQVGVAGGASLYVGPGGAVENFYGGGILGAASVGLPENVDVSFTGSRTILGPTLGLQGGWDIYDTEKLDLAPLVVLGFTSDHDAGTKTVTTTDDSGQKVEEEVPFDITYVTLAPGLGGRMVYRPTRWLAFPVVLRGSHSWVLAGRGLEQEDMPEMTWFEAQVAVVVRPIPEVGVGLGVGDYAMLSENGALGVWPIPNLNASVDVRFGGKKK